MLTLGLLPKSFKLLFERRGLESTSMAFAGDCVDGSGFQDVFQLLLVDEGFLVDWRPLLGDFDRGLQNLNILVLYKTTL